MAEKFITVVTQRGQISIPAAVRRLLGLKPGHRLEWRAATQGQVTLRVVRTGMAPGPRATFGYAARLLSNRDLSSDQVLKELREGEKD